MLYHYLLFFLYPKTVIETFPTLYEKREEDGDEEIQEEQPATFASQWGIMIYVDMCCELTKETMPNILKNMSIIDMMFFCTYAVSKGQEEKRKLEEYKRKNK